MLVGAASFFLLPAVAYSQTKAQLENEELMKHVFEFFDDVIQAGKLTPKQAIDYIQCAQNDAGEAYSKSPEGKESEKYLNKYGVKLDVNNEAANSEAVLGAYKKMSAQERAAFEARLLKMKEEQEPFEDQAEVRCMKKLGIKVPPGRAWGRY
jgi:hypothetical protein